MVMRGMLILRNQMKKKNIVKKMSLTDYKKMWGEDGPYSQVRLCEESRILDDSVSRVFLVVEAEINPFTFEYVQKHRKKFVDDEPVLQILDHAENRGKFGYVVGAGEVELQDEESRQFAKEQADMTIKTLIRMHRFVMDEFALDHDTNDSVPELIQSNNRMVWNEKMGSTEVVPKTVFFCVLAFSRYFDFKKDTTFAFMNALRTITVACGADLQDCEAFQEYMFLSMAVHLDTRPVDFIEALLDMARLSKKKPMFAKKYLLSDAKKPTPRQIMDYLASVEK